jgi:hypothetical protein
MPLHAEGAFEDELALVAAGKLRLPTKTLSLEELLKIPTGKDKSGLAIRALLADRDEGL